MKRIMFLLLLIASNASAADIITLKNGVIFDHVGHQTEKVGLCSACHEGKPGKIAGLGKEWAHKTCIECHDIFEKGPTRCEGCHKK
jgi:hypothetical protein